MNKQKRRKIRKSPRLFLILILTCLFIFSICRLFIIFDSPNVTNQKELYKYTNSFNYSYDVNLIDNPYVENSVVDMAQGAYVTKLMDYTDLKLNFNYTGSKNEKIDYHYNVTAKLIGIYTRNDQEQKVLENSYTLLEDKSFNEESSNININENLKLDLKSLNNNIEDFQNRMNMTIDATYVISFNIETITNIEGQKVDNIVSYPINVDIGKKSTSIKGENDKTETKFVFTPTEEKQEKLTVRIIVDIVIAVISSILLYYMLFKTENAYIIKNEYRAEINRILKLCEDKIVEVKNKPEIDKNKVIEVKDFSELYKLSEELFKPILFWDNRVDMEATFMVMSSSTTYKYTIKK